MKKMFTCLSLFCVGLFFTDNLATAAEAVDPNTRTSWPSAYPMGEMLLSENFQDWPSTRTLHPSPLDCNMNNRASDFVWRNIRAHRPSGEGGALINLYLVSAEIQPFCDTQSGTTYLTDTTLNTTTKLGPSNPGVSVGNITLYDSSYTMVTDTTTGKTFRKGALIVGQLPSITMIQYTTSSFGAKRGFTLEYSTDHGATWTVIRREHGKTIDSTQTTSGYQLANSPKGIIWEEEVLLNDAMLRFTINAGQPQIFRIHDLRIIGSSPLREDCDDTAFEALYGINWGPWTGVKKVTNEPTQIVFDGKSLQISGNPLWTKVTNLAGQTVRTFGSEQFVGLSGLAKGLYLIQSKDQNGLVSRIKVRL